VLVEDYIRHPLMVLAPPAKRHPQRPPQVPQRRGQLRAGPPRLITRLGRGLHRLPERRCVLDVSQKTTQRPARPVQLALGAGAVGPRCLGLGSGTLGAQHGRVAVPESSLQRLGAWTGGGRVVNERVPLAKSKCWPRPQFPQLTAQSFSFSPPVTPPRSPLSHHPPRAPPEGAVRRRPARPARPRERQRGRTRSRAHAAAAAGDPRSHPRLQPGHVTPRGHGRAPPQPHRRPTMTTTTTTT